MSDENYFNRFDELAARVRSLGCLFQNSDAITTDREMIEWQEIADQVELDLCELIYDAQYKFKVI